MLRVELDSVLSVEVYGDGSHRAVKSSTADVITLDDGPLVEDDKEEESPEVRLRLSRLFTTGFPKIDGVNAPDHFFQLETFTQKKTGTGGE